MILIALVGLWVLFYDFCSSSGSFREKSTYCLLTRKFVSDNNFRFLSKPKKKKRILNLKLICLLQPPA